MDASDTSRGALRCVAVAPGAAQEGSPVCATYGGAPGAADGSGSWSEPKPSSRKSGNVRFAGLRTSLRFFEATGEQVDSTESLRQPAAKSPASPAASP